MIAENLTNTFVRQVNRSFAHRLPDLPGTRGDFPRSRKIQTNLNGQNVTVHDSSKSFLLHATTAVNAVIISRRGATDPWRFFERESAISIRVVGVRSCTHLHLLVLYELASPASKCRRDKRAGASTEKYGKVISSFPAFGAIALPAATQTVWNCTLTRLSRHKLLSDSFYPFLPLCPSVSVSHLLSPSLSLYSLLLFISVRLLFSPRVLSHGASWTVHRKLDAYYLTRCRSFSGGTPHFALRLSGVSFSVSALVSFSASLFSLSIVREFTLYIFLIFIYSLFSSRLGSRLYTHFLALCFFLICFHYLLSLSD